MTLLTSCETDDKKEENKATAPATATVTATALSTEATESPVITEEATATTNPTENPSVIIQPTEKPTEKPTIKPTSTSKPTVAPTNKPIETVKPTTPAPTATPTPTATAKPTITLDPSVDYSQWGKHGFESLLPIPLPFSDEEADWISRKTSTYSYEVTNDNMIDLNNPKDFPKIVEEYVKSFEPYGYTVTYQSSIFIARLGREKVFTFNCGNGYLAIIISQAS